MEIPFSLGRALWPLRNGLPSHPVFHIPLACAARDTVSCAIPMAAAIPAYFSPRMILLKISRTRMAVAVKFLGE